MITVLIADTPALHRLGLRTLIASRPGLTVVGEATTSAETVRMYEELRPDVVLLGSGLPTADLTGTVRRLRKPDTSHPVPPRVLVLSATHRDEPAYDVLRAGADGFLSPATTPDELIAALFTVAAGDAVVSPALARALIHAVRYGLRPGFPVPKGRLEDLTPREREVLAAMAAGRSNTEIARHFCIAPTTVKAHVSRILAKTGARARVQAVVFAYESGLVRPPPASAGPFVPHPPPTTDHEETTCTYFSSRTTPPSPNHWNAA